MLRSALRRTRRHLGANLVGYVALFVALGGSAGAAVIISSNSQVGPNVIAGAKGPAGSTDNVINGSIAVNDLAPLSVTAGKLAQNAVTSGKIADGQVTGADLANGAVTTGKLATGAVGPSNVAAGAVGASALASDVQAPLHVSLAPTSGDPLQRGGVVLGGMSFTVDCSKFDANDPLMEVAALSNQASELDVSWLHQPAGGSVQPAIQSVSSAPSSGQLIALARDDQGQATVVWHDADETVTGTLRFV